MYKYVLMTLHMQELRTTTSSLPAQASSPTGKRDMATQMTLLAMLPEESYSSASWRFLLINNIILGQIKPHSIDLDK